MFSSGSDRSTWYRTSSCMKRLTGPSLPSRGQTEELHVYYRNILDYIRLNL